MLYTNDNARCVSVCGSLFLVVIFIGIPLNERKNISRTLWAEHTLAVYTSTNRAHLYADLFVVCACSYLNVCLCVFVHSNFSMGWMSKPVGSIDWAIKYRSSYTHTLHTRQQKKTTHLKKIIKLSEWFFCLLLSYENTMCAHLNVCVPSNTYLHAFWHLLSHCMYSRRNCFFQLLKFLFHSI